MEKIRLFTATLCVLASLLTVGNTRDSLYFRIKAEAAQLRQQGNFSEAFDLAESGLLIKNLENTEKSYLYAVMARCKRKTSEFSEAITYYEKSIDLETDKSILARRYLSLGAILYYVNLHTYAIKEYDRAIQLNTEFTPNAYYNKALSQIASSQYAEAAESLELGLEACVQYGNEIYPSRLYNQLGRVETTLYELSQDEQHSQLASDHFNYVTRAKNNLNKPIDEYKSAHIKLIDDEHGRSLHYLAQLRLQQKDTIAAIALLKRSVSLQSNLEWRVEAVNDLAQVLIDTDQIELAKTFCADVLDNVENATTYGSTLLFLFVVQQLGLTNYEHIRVVKNYTDERLKTENTYATYIGRQLIKERKLAEEKRKERIVIIALSVIGLFLLYKSLRYVYKIKKA